VQIRRFTRLARLVIGTCISRVLFGPLERDSVVHDEAPVTKKAKASRRNGSQSITVACQQLWICR